MKIILQKCLAALGMVGLCVGLIGCGKSEGLVAESTVPLERGEHIMYGSYQGEDIEWRVLDKKGDKYCCSVNTDWIYNLLIRVM